MTALPKAPKGLSRAAQAIWRDLHGAYELTPADCRVLREALTAWDRASEAAAIVDREGLTFTDERGVPRQHPAAGLELRHRHAFITALRELRLDGGALPDPRPRRGAS